MSKSQNLGVREMLTKASLLDNIKHKLKKMENYMEQKEFSLLEQRGLFANGCGPQGVANDINGI
jgi:hypothetical protein